jgi:hypothetical protein
VNKDYSASMCQTILELLHEVSHAVCRDGHAIGKGKTESME